MAAHWSEIASNIAAWPDYSDLDWRHDFVTELTSRQVDVVLDVGANSGQYASSLRAAGFEGRIVSFEPLSEPFALLRRNASRDPRWDCRQCALGDSEGTVTINVAGNAGGSSSVLPMLKSHRDVFPAANYVGTEDVPIRRLDAVVPEILAPDDVAFLKVDVQGLEEQVIAGGDATTRDRCVGMEVELSLVPLYEGGMLIREAVELVHSLGFTLTELVPCFIDVRDGRVLQADGIFFRADG